MDRAELIENVRAKPPLWDQKHLKYHNRDVKILPWKEISEKMNASGINMLIIILLIN